MDLTAWLLRHTPPVPLVVDTPGGTAARLAVERIARVRGWRMGSSPAEANLLVVTGPGGSGFAPYVDAVWRSLPAPRVRVQVATAQHAEEALAAAVAELRNVEVQRSEASRLASEPAADGGSGHEPHAQHEHAASHHGHEMHGGQDMGGMQMPGGVPMADRASDRDGLTLDRLHVPLGPVLADWPAGLVVHLALQGDVIQTATVEVVASGEEIGHGFWRQNEADVAARARRLDSCGRLLEVAGWEHAAARARLLRDEVLIGRSDHRAFDRWARRVRRSRVLRWSLAGLGVLSGPTWQGTAFAGDAADRLARWIDQAGAAMTDASERSSVDDPTTTTRAVLDGLPELLVGSELASARLVIASLDPDIEALAGAVAAHG